LLLAVLLLVSLAALRVEAQPALDHRSQLLVEVPATPQAKVIGFSILFTIAKPTEVYLKVAPIPGNVAFDNGVAGESGWWTGITLEDGSGVLFNGTTTGDPPVRFGTLQANTTYTLRLDVHAPAGALAHEAALSLDYILAQHEPSDRRGSGGTLDQSTGLHATVRVLPSLDGTTGPGAVATDRPWVANLAGLAAAALAIGLRRAMV
jgi:hypothetical protein